MPLKKQEAIRILDKLRFVVRSGGERFAKFFHNGQLVLTTAVPQGKGVVVSIPVDRFPPTEKLRDHL